MDWPGIGPIKNKILHNRRRHNRNNSTRTDYYLAYWKEHPEIRWALMAHLVSRNAGYQMSDLARFKAFKDDLCEFIIISQICKPKLGTFIGLPDLNKFFDHLFLGLFGFLETPNFLIFRDVQPQLEAYAYAKQFPDHQTEIFTLIKDPIFGTDQFAIEAWTDFFKNTFIPNTSFVIPESDIERLTYALVANEQNQIEDRVINPKRDRYINRILPGSVTSNFWLNKLKEFLTLVQDARLTKLLFPLAASQTNPRLSQLLLFEVSNFESLHARIEIGRDLYANLFKRDDPRLFIETWASNRRNKRHRGTRNDYNSDDFAFNCSALRLTPPLYSPPLIKTSGFNMKGWPPQFPGKSDQYKHIHKAPIKLPKSVSQRPGHEQWLTPVITPSQPMVQANPRDLDEVIDFSDYEDLVKQIF